MRLTLTLWMLAVAVPLAAQQPDTAGRYQMPMGMPGMAMGMPGAMMAHMGEMAGPMSRIMAVSPGHLLMHRQVLSLTDQQVTRLTALRDAARAAQQSAMADLEAHGRELMAVMSTARPDTTQLKAHFQAMQAAMMKAHWSMLSAAAQARAVLTDTQRARADGWGDMMAQMMMGHGGPMMGPGGPGMMRQRPDSMR